MLLDKYEINCFQKGDYSMNGASVRLEVEQLESRYLLAGRLFAFWLTGFGTKAPESGMDALQQSVLGDARLTHVTSRVIGWEYSNGVPLSARGQAVFALHEVERRSRELGVDSDDRYVIGGHSWGGHIAAQIIVALGLRPLPAGLVTFDPINGERTALDQSRHVYTRPADIPGSNVLNFVQRGVRLLSLGLSGYTFSGGRNDDIRGRGPDGRWGTFFNPSPDDTTHFWIDNDLSPGNDGFIGTGDDVGLGIYAEVRDFLYSMRSPAMPRNPVYAPIMEIASNEQLMGDHKGIAANPIVGQNEAQKLPHHTKQALSENTQDIAGKISERNEYTLSQTAHRHRASIENQYAVDTIFMWPRVNEGV